MTKAASLQPDTLTLPRHEAARLLEELLALRLELEAAAAAPPLPIESIQPFHRESATNLLRYLALRRKDRRPLQLRLAALGLSSLGRAESHVLHAVDTVIRMLHAVSDREATVPPAPATPDFEGGKALLARHANALLGPETEGRGVRIMVTMPAAAAHDYGLVEQLVAQGMDCVRINCAHDGPEAWARMVANLRRAETACGRSCRLLMDLAGPKLRTGPLPPGPQLARLKARRDEFGHLLAPARVWLTSAGAPAPPPEPADAVLPLTGEAGGALTAGDRLLFEDTRGRERALRVVACAQGGSWAEAARSSWVAAGAALRRGDAGGEPIGTVGALPGRPAALRLRVGDTLIVTRDQQPGRPARVAASGAGTPATIGCTLPEVFDDVRPGDPICFDDGRIGGVVRTIQPDHVVVRIERAAERGTALRADKGINLPESPLQLPAMTAADHANLAFVAEHADMVALSFANRVTDVEALIDALRPWGAEAPGVVLKIETQQGFRNLPGMLLTAMRAPACGVMIARGDLAVECGFERLAEVQEEILWICEAAHVPVIWATQVLESLAKRGLPSRAEITDAAMGHRAECVMLNKGPHILTAVKALDDILRRMQDHQVKKRAMLRALRFGRSVADPD